MRNSISSSARIVTLSTAAPGNPFRQAAIYDTVFRPAFGDMPQAELLFRRTGVHTRHLFYPPAVAVKGGPSSIAERMRIWKQGAMELGRHAVGAALSRVDRNDIGSFIMASCTGYDTPSPDMLLAGEFALPPGVRRTFVGHVGCHAAFTAIRIGLDAIAARPNEAALVHCTEITSVHIRTTDASSEQVLCQALFGDASAALVLANAQDGDGPQVLHAHTETLYEHSVHLGWSILDDGFRMSISPSVPALIGDAVAGFVERLLAPLRMRTSDVRHWGIHPGGPKIINAVARALSLCDAQTAASHGVLADFGNCSSPTILMVLDRLLEEDRPQAGEYGVLLGFGPGLTMEGLVLRF